MLVAGLMSGTSLDGMDAALLRISDNGALKVEQKYTGISTKFSPTDRNVLSHAVEDALQWQFSGPTPHSFEHAAMRLASIAAKAIDDLLASNGIKNTDLTAIGFHGQTVLHRPPVAGKNGKTLQLGNAQQLANKTGCTIVHDFRSMDMDFGGHGAPLAPAWHFEIAKQLKCAPFAFINIGGVSNITFVPEIDGDNLQANMLAFDCGPGNGPVDAWIASHGLGQMDVDGQLAARGVVDHDIVADVIKELPVAGCPFSLDRWAFDHKCVQGLSVEDGAATLLEITACGIVRGLSSLPKEPGQVLVGGGGRLNPVLMTKLTELGISNIAPSEAAGFDGDLIEAEAFAWLSALRLHNHPTSWPGTTGVLHPVSGGAICDPCD